MTFQKGLIPWDETWAGFVDFFILVITILIEHHTPLIWSMCCYCQFICITDWNNSRMAYRILNFLWFKRVFKKNQSITCRTWQLCKMIKLTTLTKIIAVEWQRWDCVDFWQLWKCYFCWMLQTNFRCPLKENVVN